MIETYLQGYPLRFTVPPLAIYFRHGEACFAELMGAMERSKKDLDYVADVALAGHQFQVESRTYTPGRTLCQQQPSS